MSIIERNRVRNDSLYNKRGLLRDLLPTVEAKPGVEIKVNELKIVEIMQALRARVLEIDDRKSVRELHTAGSFKPEATDGEYLSELAGMLDSMVLSLTEHIARTNKNSQLYKKLNQKLAQAKKEKK